MNLTSISKNGNANENALTMTSMPTSKNVENKVSEPMPAEVNKLEEWPLQEVSLSKFTVKLVTEESPREPYTGSG